MESTDKEAEICSTCMGRQVFKNSTNGAVPAACSKCGGDPSKDDEKKQ